MVVPSIPSHSPALHCALLGAGREKKNALSIPIQALAMRSQKDLAEAKKSGSSGSVTLAASNSDSAISAKADIQGVFVVRGNKVQFVPVQTGISGVTDIEVTSGLQLGDQIVIGSYKALRTLKPGTSIKIDNSASTTSSTT